MNIETAKKCVNSKQKKYVLERRKDVFGNTEYANILVGVGLGMTVAATILKKPILITGCGIITAIMGITTGLITIKEYMTHPNTIEIERLKRIKKFLDKGVNVLEDTTTFEFNNYSPKQKKLI